MKKIYLTALVFISLSATASSLPDISSFSQQQIFKSWVQNRCIGKISQDKGLMEDAKASAAAWLEFSKLPIEDFQKADAAIDNLLKEKLGGSVDSPYLVLKCTLIAESQPVQAIYAASKK